MGQRAWVTDFGTGCARTGWAHELGPRAGHTSWTRAWFTDFADGDALTQLGPSVGNTSWADELEPWSLKLATHSLSWARVLGPRAGP